MPNQKQSSTQPRDHQLKNKKSPWHRSIILLAVIFVVQQVSVLASEQSRNLDQPAIDLESKSALPANHRVESNQNEVPSSPAIALQEAEMNSNRKTTSSRSGRQYDGSLSTSGTGNYAALASDSAAYVGNTGLPSISANYNSGSANGMSAAYSSEPMNSNMYSSAAANSAYHDQLSLAARTSGYPQMHGVGSYPIHPPSPPPMSFGGPLASMFPGAGGLSSGFPLMAKGFDLAEIVCTAIAIAIGAVIVGAPFILLYIFVVNHMQGNGPNALGPGGGSISLTGPTSSTNVTGRKKRHTNLSDALFKQLSPMINQEQLAQAFKLLMNSLSKYQV